MRVSHAGRVETKTTELRAATKSRVVRFIPVVAVQPAIGVGSSLPIRAVGPKVQGATIMTLLSIVAVSVLSLVVMNRVLVTVAPVPPQVRDIPKGGIPRVGKPCGFDR